MIAFLFFGIFMAGVVFATNLSGLIETSDSYDYQWWKVAASVVVAITCSAVVWTELKPPVRE